MNKKHILSIIVVVLISITFLNIQYTNSQIKDTIILWYQAILPTVPVSYFLGTLLYHFHFIISIFYPFFRKIYSFENKHSFILYIISLIVGNPTSTLLIINSLNNGEISYKEATRLLRFCSFVSIFFILFILKPIYSFPVLFGQIMSTIVISQKDRQKESYLNTKDEFSLIPIIEKLPFVLLNILSTMIFITIIKTPFNIIFSESKFLVPTFLSFFEITSGLTTITFLYTNIPLIFFSSLLISFHGLAIIIQVIIFLKQKML